MIKMIDGKQTHESLLSISNFKTKIMSYINLKNHSDTILTKRLIVEPRLTLAPATNM